MKDEGGIGSRRRALRSSTRAFALVNAYPDNRRNKDAASRLLP